MLKLYQFEYDVVGFPGAYIAAETFEEALAVARRKRPELDPWRIRVVETEFYLVGQEEDD